MACTAIPVDEGFKKRLELFPWVNWSEIAREEALKKDIFERYIKTGEVTDEDWKICEELDWHPVDELPEKEEHVAEMKRRLKEGKFIEFKSVSEIFDPE